MQQRGETLRYFRGMTGDIQVTQKKPEDSEWLP